MAFIEFRNVSYAVDGKNILKNIAFTVEKGEFVGILGANASGKSTLAKLTNGLILPTEGKVFVDNFDTAASEDLQNIRQKVGIVFQNPDNQIVASTVEDDVAFGAENLNVEPEEIEKRIDDALKLTGLEDKRKFSPYMLSGGQKQKVAIAGVLAMHSEAVIFDEATSMLDPKSKSEVLNKIYELNKENKITIIYITHFIEEVLDADKIIILDNGEIAKIGTPREIFSDKRLKNWKLEVPFANILTNKLIENGVKISEDIYDEKSLIAELEKQKRG